MRRRSCTSGDDGGDDAHGFDVIPYQITCNFDNAMKLAASKKIKTLDPKKPGYYFYFEGGDEMFCYKARKDSETLVSTCAMKVNMSKYEYENQYE